MCRFAVIIRKTVCRFTAAFRRSGDILASSRGVGIKMKIDIIFVDILLSIGAHCGVFRRVGEEIVQYSLELKVVHVIEAAVAFQAVWWNKRKSDGFRFVFLCKIQAVSVTGTKLFFFFKKSAFPYRAYCMNDIFLFKIKSRSYLSFARSASAELFTVFFKLFSRSFVNSAVNSAAAQQRTVCGIYDNIAVQIDYIIANYK